MSTTAKFLTVVLVLLTLSWVALIIVLANQSPTTVTIEREVTPTCTKFFKDEC